MDAVIVPECGDASVMELRDVERPAPDAGEVLIDVAAIGVNWTEVDYRRGNYPDQAEPPFVPGVEVSGRIRATGEGVDRWTVGDEVVAFPVVGGYAESVTARADWVFPKPEGLGLEEAAGALVQGFTAHNVLHEWAGVEAGETVLIYAAAGGVGSTAVQIASEAGATVVGTASTEDKLAFAESCGADHAINYESEDVRVAVSDVAPEGVDLVLDGVGGSPFYQSFDVLRQGGRIVVYGVASGSIPTVATPRVYGANAAVIGYNFHRAMEDLRERVMAAQKPLYDAWADGSLEPKITDRRPLSEAAAVHEEMEARETSGKLLLVP